MVAHGQVVLQAEGLQDHPVPHGEGQPKLVAGAAAWEQRGVSGLYPHGSRDRRGERSPLPSTGWDLGGISWNPSCPSLRWWQDGPMVPPSLSRLAVIPSTMA